VLGALLPWLSGCETPPTAGTGPAAPAQATTANPSESLQKGMTAAQVRACLGEPDEIKPLGGGELRSEVWVYRRFVSNVTRPVMVTTEEVPYINPITGQSTTIPEPVISHELISTSMLTELLMIEGRLFEWKHRPRSEQKMQ
jgi:hypothetical protein